VDFNEEVEIGKKLTMYTFEVQIQAPFCLKFKIPGFENRIYLKPGTHSINAPYHEGTLADLVEVEEQNRN
jgi:hypothetical protein